MDLSYSVVDAEGVREILHILPELRKLRIAWGQPLVAECNELDLDRMGQFLREGAGKLEVLDLDFFESFEYCEAEARGRLGSLRELVNLRELSIQPTVLVGEEPINLPDSEDDDDENGDPQPLVLMDVLPDRLEYLCLYQGAREFDWSEEAAKSLLGSERLPRLRTAVMNDTTNRMS